jgi:hypothetical protein
MFDEDFNPYDRLVELEAHIEFLQQKLHALGARVDHQVSILSAINNQNSMIHDHLVMQSERISRLENKELTP